MSSIVKKLDYYISTSELFDKFHKEPMAAFLDSSLKNKLGRYSIIGLNPYLTIKEVENTLYVNNIERDESYEEFMKDYLKNNIEENNTELPMISGAIGFMSYDYGRKFEQITSRHKSKLSMPSIIFCFYEHYIIEDLDEEVIYIIAKGKLESAEGSLKKLEAMIEKPLISKLVAGDIKSETETSFSKEEYMKAVDTMKNYIVEGDIYIANMTQQLRIKSNKNPYEVFKYLRKHNPSPFGGYFNYGDFQIISASPERFICMKDKWIETRPIKGTRKRGYTKEEDTALRNELENSDKDRSELLMIVDLERNDLNRVCIPGTVKVTENFAVEAYATVFHLVSTVVGKLKENLTVVDLIKSTFPGGSITGAPKIRAMEIVDELEHDSRGLYTGSIGYITLDEKCDFNIVIRTAVHQKGVYHLGVGGGITCESDLEFEYEETLQKAKAILEALEC